MGGWLVLLSIMLLVLLVITITLFAKISKRNQEYYKNIHSELLSLVPVKIDLANNVVFFSEELSVLNHQKKVSLYVFKSMINRRSKVELEVFFQNLLTNKLIFQKITFAVTFQLEQQKIIYDLEFDYFDQSSQILYGKLQSNTKYNLTTNLNQLNIDVANDLLAKNVFFNTINDFFANENIVDNNSLKFEYLFLVKINNYESLETILTINHLKTIEQLLIYYLKVLFNTVNIFICKYQDGQYLVYMINKKINFAHKQKKLNQKIKQNILEKNTYLQIQTHFLIVSVPFTANKSLIYNLHDEILISADENNQNENLTEIKLKVNNLAVNEENSRYHLLYSQAIKSLLTVIVSPVYADHKAKAIAFYFAHTKLLPNPFYSDYFLLVKNIQGAGLFWKIYEPLFLKIFQDYEQLKVSKDLVVPLILSELENNTVLSQILNLINKKKHLFAKANLYFEFRDSNFSIINNWTKYQSIIKKLRENNIKIAVTHEMKNINNFKVISSLQPDLVVLSESILKKLTFNFDKYITISICLYYLKILKVKKILCSGVNGIYEIILLKSLKIDYFSGPFFENKQTLKNIDVLQYESYWELKKGQQKKV